MPENTSKQPFSLGGQALIEGVMMRSPHFIGAAVRRADGTIETRVERFDSVLLRHPILRAPIVRGVVALAEMMFVGARYLNWSGEVALQGEGLRSGVEGLESEPAPAASTPDPRP